jgi:hypothetical protein
MRRAGGWPRCPSGYTVTRSFTATMFLLWTSSFPNSIPVPLGYQSWGFSGSAQQNATGAWIPTVGTQPVPGLIGGFVPSDSTQTTDGYTALQYGFPTWSGPSTETCN